MRLLNEFKAFAMRGNVVEMAIGIIIGAAFGKVVSAFVAIKVMNNLKRQEVEEPVAPPVETLSKEEILLGEIRDLLAQQRQ
jgi:large-conductance mechanosensitive channel